MRLKLYRITAFAATSLACVFISFGVSVSAQEAEAEATPIEATIDSEAIPGEAKTTENPTIEVEDLELLAKPLTLEELQNEAAAWLILLKNKVQKISDAEITVRHQNRKLEAQQESIKLIEDAEAQLAAAQNAPQAAQLETAKEALKKAVDSVKEVRVTEARLADNQALLNSLKQGRKERGIKEAKELVEQAEKIRASISVDSPQFLAATEKIESLKESITSLEQAEADIDATVPASAEYQEAEAKAVQAREAMKKARSELRAIVSELVDESATSPDSAIADIDVSTENLAQQSAKIEAEFAQTTANLEGIEAKLDVNTLDQSQVQEAEQQLDQLTKVLNQKIDKENELKKQLVVNITDFESERAGMINRFTAILDALDKKGGDSASYRKYMETVSSVDIDLTDTEGLGVRAVSWLTSPEGGLHLLVNIAKFGGILLISVLIAPQVGKISDNILKRVGGMSTLFRGFTVMIIKRGVVVLGFLLGLAALGVNLGPILALIGGASFILAFALQSNLANFASGLMLLINKPFDVGDEIKVAGYWAYVDSISIASTKIKDFSGNIVTLPNNTVWGSDIINYTHADLRKIGLAIHVRFGQDLDLVYEMWKEIASAHPQVLDDPQPSWFPWNSHYSSYIYVNLTAWSTTEDYWYVYVDLLRTLQKRIKELNIDMASPRQEILLNQSIPKALASQKPLLE